MRSNCAYVVGLYVSDVEVDVSDVSDVLSVLLAVMIEMMFRGATAFVVGVIVVFMVNSSCMYRWGMDDYYGCVRYIFFFRAFVSQYRKPAPAPRLEQVFDGGARPVSFF